jgi:hypothetical protein
LDRKQQEHNCRDLLSLVAKNSSVAIGPETVTRRNDRYAARVASAEKAHLHTDLLAVSTNICVHSISDVAEKILFDGDRGKSAKLVPIAELVTGEEESNTGKEDNEDSKDSSAELG